MPLTEAEVRQILIREKKRKRRRKRVIRRITFLIILLLTLILGIGIFLNRDALNSPFTGKGVIFIDPGHGGVDSGADGLGRNEADDVLELGLAVRDELEDMGYKVYMSRTTDEDVGRKERGEMANKRKAKFMISLHRNQSNTEGEGVEVWIPAANDSESRILGENIMEALGEQGFYARGTHAGTLVDPNDDYYENSVPTMPSCLAEIGFISDKGDNKLYSVNLKENAKAIAKAIDKSFVEVYGESE